MNQNRKAKLKEEVENAITGLVTERDPMRAMADIEKDLRNFALKEAYKEQKRLCDEVDKLREENSLIAAWIDKCHKLEKEVNNLKDRLGDCRMIRKDEE